jgi:5-methylcytosine-specific restriction endonuclease McrA
MSKRIIVCQECGKQKYATFYTKFCSIKCYKINTFRKKYENGEITYRHKRAIKTYLIYTRGHKCEECRNTTWLNKQIPLELHHKDGDITNIELSNLQLVCPNCHTLTDTYKSKNKNEKSNRKMYKKTAIWVDTQVDNEARLRIS